MDHSSQMHGPGLEGEYRTSPVSLLAGVTAAALVTGLLVFVAPRELWLDETHSMHLSRMSLPNLWQYVRGDVHPPLYFLLLNLWQKMLGDSPMALRLFGAVAHVAGVVAFYFLAKSVFSNRSIAVTGALLFLLSPALIYHAGDARMYSLAVLIVVLLLQRAMRFLAGNTSVANAIAIGALSALAFYVHYGLLFFVAGLLAFLMIWSLRDRQRVVRAFQAGVVFAILVLPWLPVVLAQRARKIARGEELVASRANPEALTFGTETGAPRGMLDFAKEAVRDVASIAGIFPADSTLVMGLMAVPLLVALALCLLALFRPHRVFVLLLATVALFCIAGNMGLGLMGRRYLIWFAPLCILALLVGVNRLREFKGGSRRLVFALSAALVLVYFAGALRVPVHPEGRPFGIASAFLKENSLAGDRLLISATYAQVPFDYYADRAGLGLRSNGFPVDIYSWWESQEFKGWGGPIITQQDVAALHTSLDSLPVAAVLWLVEFEENYYDPKHKLRASFAERGTWTVRSCELHKDVGHQLKLYAILRVEATRQPAGCGS